MTRRGCGSSLVEDGVTLAGCSWLFSEKLSGQFPAAVLEMADSGGNGCGDCSTKRVLERKQSHIFTASFIPQKMKSSISVQRQRPRKCLHKHPTHALFTASPKVVSVVANGDNS